MLENMNIEVKLMTMEIVFVNQNLILKYLDNLRIMEYGKLANKILIFFDISKDTDAVIMSIMGVISPHLLIKNKNCTENNICSTD